MSITANAPSRRISWGVPETVSSPVRWLAAVSLLSIGVAFGALLTLGSGDLTLRDRLATEQREAIIVAARSVGRMEDEAETAERGYLLTGEPSFIAGIQTALEVLPGSAARLRRLVAGDPAQAARAAALEAVVARRTEHLMHAVELRRNLGARAAREFVLRPEVREVDRRLRGLLTEILDAEQARPRQR